MKKYIVSALLTMTTISANSAEIVAPDELSIVKASEAVVSEPVAERWGGVYLGIAAGGAFLTDTAPAEGNGGAYGGFVGYNKQWGSFVAGIEASADSADITFDDGSGVKSRFIYSGRVRAGWANDLLFAYGSIGAQHGVTNLPAPFTKDTTLQLGAGLDVAVTKHISLGVDFTYAKYKKFAELPLDVDTKKIQARLSYTFN